MTIKQKEYLDIHFNTGVKEFFMSRCKIHTGSLTRCSVLFREYNAFCTSKKLFPVTYKKFRSSFLTIDSRIGIIQKANTYLATNIQFKN